MKFKSQVENDLIENSNNELQFAYDLADVFVNKNYLSELSEFELKEISSKIKNLKIRDTFRFFKINKIVYDKKENNLDKLSNVYNALDDINSSIIMILDSNRHCVNLYIGVRVDNKERDTTIDKYILQNSFKGNFPGSELKNLNNSQIKDLRDEIFKSRFREKMKVVSSVSGIPSLMDENKDNFVQGIEKLIDSMQGEKYSAIFIADTVSKNQTKFIKAGYENIYTELSTFEKNELNFAKNHSESVTEGITEGLTQSISNSITQTQSYTEGNSTTKSASGNLSLSGDKLGISFGKSKNTNQNSSETKSNTNSSTESESSSIQKSISSSRSTGRSESIQIHFQNKKVSNLLKKIDHQLERLRESEDFGLWNAACYFLADDKQTATIAASNYKALMRGEKSALENSYINIWDNKDKNKLKKVEEYLKTFHHPIFDIQIDDNITLPKVTPGSLISGRELTIQMGLPTKSVNGVTILESAEFGRNIIKYENDPDNEKIKIGNIFHMGLTENTKVELDLNSLTGHTFITGSTGSGKSNTIYKILDKIRKNDRTFLVIEPAKGEYKEIFGGLNEVNVYGTNPNYTELLRINPFRFPKNIHVLEHIDRLVEIFNACWPMYAAMPSVLKESIELSYQKVGWDIENSIYLGNEITYPTFNILLEVLPKVINRSNYSSEVKSNYTGALVTRVKSLTNGLVGQILIDNEIDNEKIFNENCIVDLSRIGSMETKSLLMGIVFMRLNEDRYSNSDGYNSKLKHITVLEEAHNLLRKSSSGQSKENSNLQGKSVEMISNSIAEMRTYGEGFIIADQSPDILDPSVIKNTNTKIILRLPDESDRNLVGKTANLNDDQIKELSKLRTGVAAIYQNNWLEPILCKVDEYKSKRPYNFNKENDSIYYKNKKIKSHIIKLLIEEDNENNNLDLNNIDIEGFKEWLFGSNLNNDLEEIIINNLDQLQNEKRMDLWNKDQFETKSKIIWSLIESDKVISFAKDAEDLNEWTENIKIALRKYINLENESQIENKIVKHLLHYEAIVDEEFEELYFNWCENIERRII